MSTGTTAGRHAAASMECRSITTLLSSGGSGESEGGQSGFSISMLSSASFSESVVVMSDMSLLKSPESYTLRGSYALDGRGAGFMKLLTKLGPDSRTIISVIWTRAADESSLSRSTGVDHFESNVARSSGLTIPPHVA